MCIFPIAKHVLLHLEMVTPLIPCTTSQPLLRPEVFRRQVRKLSDAALDPDPDACRRAADGLMRSGVTAVAVADDHIPAAARWIGEQWMQDEVSFAEVTISVSRLQTLLRCLGENPQTELSGGRREPGVLLLVSHDNDHTLGAMVLLGQLRRRGCSVRLLLGARPDTLSEKIAGMHFDAVMISAAQGNRMETLRRLVLAVRRAGQDAPIVIGGSIVESEPELCRRTGADHAEKDLQRALKLCRLTGKLRQWQGNRST
jgi:methanogenic corrinoid protein MtbC1